MRVYRITVPIEVRGQSVDVDTRSHYEDGELYIDEYLPRTDDASLYDEARDKLRASDVEAALAEDA